MKIDLVIAHERIKHQNMFNIEPKLDRIETISEQRTGRINLSQYKVAIGLFLVPIWFKLVEHFHRNGMFTHMADQGLISLTIM